MYHTLNSAGAEHSLHLHTSDSIQSESILFPFKKINIDFQYGNNILFKWNSAVKWTKPTPTLQWEDFYNSLRLDWHKNWLLLTRLISNIVLIRHKFHEISPLIDWMITFLYMHKDTISPCAWFCTRALPPTIFINFHSKPSKGTINTSLKIWWMPFCVQKHSFYFS